jgi:hypothetical protein
MARWCPFTDATCRSDGPVCVLWNGKCAFVRIADSLEKLAKSTEDVQYLNSRLTDIIRRLGG